jgi:hypothetical protein
MERLLQGRRGLLRLAAVTLEALLGFEVATLSGFCVFFCVSFRPTVCPSDDSASMLSYQ